MHLYFFSFFSQTSHRLDAARRAASSSCVQSYRTHRSQLAHFGLGENALLLFLFVVVFFAERACLGRDLVGAVIVVFLLLQRQVTAGMLSGAVKG